MLHNATKILIASTATLALSATAASAQTSGMDDQQDRTTASTTNAASGIDGTARAISLPDWHPDLTAANSVSVDSLIDRPVYGPTGDEIGDVENVLIGADGKALSIIAEVGGVWDIGDTHVSIPWDVAKIDAGQNRVTVPVTEDNLEDYSLFDRDMITKQTASTNIQNVDSGWFEDADTGPRVWRATELVDDYVRLNDQGGWTNYGYVDDILLKDGMVSAVVVRPDNAFGANGRYAYPFYGYDYGWSPGLANYDMPYSRNDIANREPLDGSMFDG
ncbi:PRC-barrel domain-containing protein [Aurantimonas sp. VKM B-3413]|uniref:PRC-barrel domain-containing protein n=1 Tax=Aurantimonas sp. VKM B-3413 TaxID=2779401 RepID=UPI001E4B5D10|nr:PRC-barrel domain-containing protein [Aurantimonas sp. VKM B-3413]MCB8839855.1 PRC-barrel domain-containing protein [Aurantimonas sp. VKM B-3413]